MPLEFATGLTVDVVPPDVPALRVAPPDNSIIVVPVVGPPGVAGPVGPQGPQGPPGSIGNAGYVHTQLAANDIWIIPHGLGYPPAGLLAKDSVGDIIEPADVIHLDPDTTRLLFTGRPVSGTAIVS